MEQKADLSPVTIAKPRFVLANMLFISLLLLGGHVGLVKLYELGDDLTTITGSCRRR